MTLILVSVVSKGTVILGADGTSLIGGFPSRAKIGATRFRNVAVAVWGDFAPAFIPFELLAVAEQSGATDGEILAREIVDRANVIARRANTNVEDHWCVGVCGWRGNCRTKHPWLLTLGPERLGSSTPSWQLKFISRCKLVRPGYWRGCNPANRSRRFRSESEVLAAVQSRADEGRCRGACGTPYGALAINRP
jgi:hypothetical protein